MQARAIVADDHPLFRSALKHAVLGTLGDNILESASFDETLDLLNIHQNIELVFLDLNMPGNHGLTGLTVLRNHYPDVLVLKKLSTLVPAAISPNLPRYRLSLKPWCKY
jgi:DNA-binding NarL/FixJ family response regulator